MTTYRSPASFLRSLAIGTAVNVGAIAPALAMPPFAFPVDVVMLSARDIHILLYGSIALLVVALAAKVIRVRHYHEPPPRGPDLRWWKNPPPSPQP